MSKIIFTDSELYELLIAVCNNEYMPNPVSLFTREDNGVVSQMTVDAMSIKITEPLSAAACSSKDSLKIYISEFINTSLKKYGKSFCFYPFKIIKSNKGTSLILRGSFQKTGWSTNFKETDKHRIKTELDKVELAITNS